MMSLIDIALIKGVSYAFEVHFSSLSQLEETLLIWLGGSSVLRVEPKGWIATYCMADIENKFENWSVAFLCRCWRPIVQATWCLSLSTSRRTRLRYCCCSMLHAGTRTESHRLVSNEATRSNRGARDMNIHDPNSKEPGQNSEETGSLVNFIGLDTPSASDFFIQYSEFRRDWALHHD